MYRFRTKRRQKQSMEQVKEKQQSETVKKWNVAKTATGQYRVHSAGPIVRNHLTPGQHESFSSVLAMVVPEHITFLHFTIY